MARRGWGIRSGVTALAAFLAALAFSAPSALGTGSTLVVDLSGSDVDYVDPALAYYDPSWQILYATCAKLVNFPDASGAPGTRVQPELAAGMPTVANGGTTYTFTIRSDYRFSTGATVTAADVKASFDRLMDPGIGSPGYPFFQDITSVAAVGSQVTLTLAQAAPDLVARLAMPFFCVLPASTPATPGGVNTIQTAGPYYVADRTPGSDITLERNPYYAGTRPAHFDRIVYHVKTDAAASMAAIEAGTVDYDAGGVASSSEQHLWDAYGPQSPAAGRGEQQYFVNPTRFLRYLALNSTAGRTLSNPKLRQAVNFALDRPAMIQLAGTRSGTPTDQYLSPSMPGFQDAALYPLDGPDVAKAQALVDEAGGAGAIVVYTASSALGMNQGNLIKTDLERVGFTVTVQAFQSSALYKKCGTRGEPFDICNVGWVPDYGDPLDTLFLLDGRLIHDTNNANMAYFNDDGFNTKLDAAAALSGEERYAAFGDLDVQVARDSAPWAAYEYENNRAFFARRIGCQTYQPLYGIDLGALCERPAASPPPAPPPPPPPTPPPPPPAPPVVCLVPRVTGQTVAVASGSLTAGHCALGSVRTAFSSVVGAGRILAQSVTPGTTLADGASVDVVVSRGKKKPPPKLVKLCYRHRTIKVTKTKAAKLRKHGAKLGACKKR